MKKIKLTQGKFAIVDDEDYGWLSKYKWCVKREGRHNWYAISKVAGRMHRVVLGCHTETNIDHKNGDGLDNRKENLRECTQKQNCFNRRKNYSSGNKFKGVRPSRWKKWEARIKVNGKEKYLGSFMNEHDAALAYNNAALMYFGEFAHLNIV